MLDSGLWKMVLGYFNCDLEKFKLFHREEDHNEYLEINQDRDRYQEEQSQEIIAAYFKRFGMTDV